ncbi:caspase-8-like [Dysidea avara]|uniref:caspase-8-like n=1 Tax=Dysidea avara TaxID=196820 RepID=UPI00332ABFBD
MNDEGFLASGTHFSYSVETIPSAPLELRENHYADTSNVVHLVAGTKGTYQGGGTEPLQYGQGSSHAQIFPSHFQQTSSNGSLKRNYPVPVQTYDDDIQKSNAVPDNGHPLLVPHGRSSTGVYQTLQIPGIFRQQTNTVNATPLNNAYRHLLRKIIKSLSTEEVDDLCFISTEVNSSSVRNKANFSGMVLFKFFEQRMLITAENLDYLQSLLKDISRIDLCHLIDEYTNTYLSETSFTYREPFTKPHLHVEPHPLPTNALSSVESRPPPFNPEFSDHIPAQPQLPQHNPVQCTKPEQVNTCDLQQEYSLPTQEEDEEYDPHGMVGYNSSVLIDSLRTQVDGQMFHGGTTSSCNSEQLLQQIRLLQLDLTAKNNENHVLQQEMNNQKKIQKHYVELIEKLLAEGQGKSDPVAERYLMRKWPHGIAIIINNYEFHSTGHIDEKLSNREGSLVDENNLNITWEYLGYKVQVLKNLKASEFTRELMQVALQSHENYDSFVCCILSHGYLDGVYGTDGELVKFNDIVKLFKGNFCPTLVNKPKLFFIQACRGDAKDEAVSEQKDGPGPDKMSNSLPSEADFFFGYATPPGYASWRSREYGSWYISSLCEVLVDNASQQDFLSMLTMVTNKVSEAYTNEGDKQCPVPVSRLRKQVWFFGNS